jgi:hypothetical protein
MKRLLGRHVETPGSGEVRLVALEALLAKYFLPERVLFLDRPNLLPRLDSARGGQVA